MFNVSDSGATINTTSDLKINVLKYYVSHIRLYSNGTLVAQDPALAHLIDASDTSSSTCIIPVHKNVVYDEIRFDLGIDSTTNVSGVLGGDLDPTKGMYWTWQSGYINFKLEGNAQQCTNSKKEFIFHIGGYAHPYGCIREVSLKTGGASKAIVVLELKTLFDHIQLDKEANIMSPSQSAVSFSKLLQKSFIVKEP
ncbi:MAG: hypothetical protein JNL24_14005 [Bacteroidia bacterium]|nr:hypothetical protein [Bacteroidia bacterium]